MDASLDGYDAFERRVNPVLGRLLRAAGREARFVRASGATLEDGDGRRYDDWIAGFGALNLGHNPPALADEIRAHLASGAPNLVVEQPNPWAGRLAEALVRVAGPGFETAYFCNSGAEAVEAAIKAALLATGRPRIVCADGAYHGTTLGALACTGAGPYRDGCERMLPDLVRRIPFDDVAALERALEPGDAAAFLVEPVQMEAGARIPQDDYLPRVRTACSRRGALLILDEVQTGMGRTGNLFAFQETGAAPDILVLAKSLGGGMAPIGAAVCGRGIWSRAFGTPLRHEMHNSTFGGNALACRVALRTLEIISGPGFLEGVRRRGRELFRALGDALEGLASVEHIAGRGLLGGLRLREPEHPWLRWDSLGFPDFAGRPVSGPLLADRLFRRGILAQVCGHDWSVLRVEPPLDVDEPACRRFVAAVRDSLVSLEKQGFADRPVFPCVAATRPERTP